jgi:predicted amidophosphoribosyltransferase
MSLRACPSCGNNVSKQAEFCPNCGHPFKSNKENSKGISFWGIVGAVVVAILIISYC